MTRAEKRVEFLKEMGGEEIIPSKSRKYRQFILPGRDYFHWVGKAGAVRVGKTIATSSSVSFVK